MIRNLEDLNIKKNAGNLKMKTSADVENIVFNFCAVLFDLFNWKVILIFAAFSLVEVVSTWIVILDERINLRWLQVVWPGTNSIKLFERKIMTPSLKQRDGLNRAGFQQDFLPIHHELWT